MGSWRMKNNRNQAEFSTHYGKSLQLKIYIKLQEMIAKNNLKKVTPIKTKLI